MSYIVPRDKPQGCMKCPYINQYNDCRLIWGSERIRTVEEQYQHCPLIEVPPHGRLGDLDALWNRMYKYSDNEGAKMPFGDNDFMIHRDSACELIEDAPTVIEAEE